MIENQTYSFSESMYYGSVSVFGPMLQMVLVHTILKFIYECTGYAKYYCSLQSVAFAC